MDNNKKIIISLCVVILIIFYFKNDVFSFLKKEEKIDFEIIEEINIIDVHIDGEVMFPGVYSIPNTMLLNDLLNIACLKESADIENINLSEVLIPNNYYVIKEKNITITEETKNPKININTATKEELMKLNNIGSATADNIINYRKNNIFKSIEDIMKVTGIKEKTFEAIKDFITI